MRSPYFDGFFAGLKPDTRLTVSEWADEHRILPMKSAKEAGRWRTAKNSLPPRDYGRHVTVITSRAGGVYEGRSNRRN